MIKLDYGKIASLDKRKEEEKLSELTKLEVA